MAAVIGGGSQVRARTVRVTLGLLVVLTAGKNPRGHH